MAIQLKIITLNCWGIPCLSSNRSERITAIASELLAGSYDFAVLQEVWSNSDYNWIADSCATALPYSHYFHSGVIGAGICIFSKAPIIDALFQCWTLNGYAHKIQHGDWFGGKGVGLCKVLYQGLKINVYTAHLHAEYHRPHDEYLSHRICQAFEFSQFVKMTGETSDLNIVAGDFNTEPDDLAYRIIRYNANLLDSFLHCEQKMVAADEVGGTSEHPRNSYTSKASLKTCPDGKRIDYVFYNYNSGTEVTCVSCTTPLDKCPDQSFSFSDHEAVVATLYINKGSTVPPAKMPLLVKKEVFEEADLVLENSVKKLQGDRLFYFIVSALLFCLILATISTDTYIPLGFITLLAVIRILLAIAMAFCIFMGSVWNRIEYNATICVQKVLHILLRNFAEKEAHKGPKSDSSQLLFLKL